MYGVVKDDKSEGYPNDLFQLSGPKLFKTSFSYFQHVSHNICKLCNSATGSYRSLSGGDGGGGGGSSKSDGDQCKRLVIMKVIAFVIIVRFYFRTQREKPYVITSLTMALGGDIKKAALV